MTGNNLHHRIRKQDFEVEFNGSESEGLNLQRSLPDLCHNRLIPAIQNALDRYAPSNAYLSIDRLNIDAGTVTLDRLDRDLSQIVETALGIYFQNLPPTDELSNSLEKDHIQSKTKQQTISAAFIFFLKHGTLPWSFHLPSGSGFEEMIQESLAKQEGRGNALELIKHEVIETLASATARMRLIQQFTPALLETLLAWISPDGIPVISGIIQLLRRFDTALVDMKLLEQELWATLFTSIASGIPLTETNIRRETKALVMALGVRGASLAAELDFSWSHLSDWPDEAKIIVHHESTTPDSATSEREGQSHPESGKSNQAKRLKEQANLSQRPNGGENDAKTVTPDGITTVGSVTSVEEELSHPETGEEDQTTCLTNPDSLSQQRGGRGDKAQKIVHHESITPESERSKGAEKSDPVKIDDQPKSLLSPAASSQQPERSVEEEREARHQTAKAKEPVSPSAVEHPDAKAGIYTGLAGLVLLHPFLPQFFRALGIADDDNLLRPDKAIYLLNFLATGNTDAKEYELVIPKILCQFPLQRAVESNISLVTAEQEEAVVLLAAVIRHWEVLKNTGTEGLRETFLKRSGKLSLLDNGEWLLQIESNTCDILLEQLPWGIAMIKLPWMHEMLRVEWI
jgi:hypothetical protein